MKKKGAFTLIEVLIAVVILGLAGAASIKLVTMSHRTLEEVRVQRELISKGKELQFSAIRGVLPDSGEEEGFSWELRKHSIPVLEGQWTVNYRTLDLSFKERHLLLYQP